MTKQNALLFGNENLDFWKLKAKRDDREGIVVISGKLHAGFFDADTPMGISPNVLRRFMEELEEMDKAVQGSATLQSANAQSEVRLSMRLNNLGHLFCLGEYKINGNELKFTIKTDQMQISSFSKWLKSILS